MINILYVEDEPSLAMIVADSLEANGFQVVHCNNGEEALESFSIAKPDIMVVDVMMPVMDGFTLAAKIRATRGPSQSSQRNREVKEHEST